jgi:hypothetical protein
MTSGTTLVDSMADLVLAEAGACEQNRTMTRNVVDAMWECGLMSCGSRRI